LSGFGSYRHCSVSPTVAVSSTAAVKTFFKKKPFAKHNYTVAAWVISWTLNA